MFSMRVFMINYYLAKPEPGLDQLYSDFRCLEIKQVPVLRVFGSTPSGQKTCLHVHDVFPYLLVKPFKTFANHEELTKYTFELSNQIDRLLNVSLCVRDPNASQHVYKIEPILTKSMYGYYKKDSLFLKIFLYHPEVVKKLSELLLTGNIMGEALQTFESHVPFNLQFLMDYNLFGMNWIHLEKFKFRKKAKIEPESEPLSQSQKTSSSTDDNQYWNVDSLNEDLLLDETIERQSTCELELDCIGADIQNPNMNKDGKMLNPGLSALWEEEQTRREFLNIKTPLETPDNEERTNVLVVENEIEFKKRLIHLLEKRFESKYPFKNNDSNDENKNQEIQQQNQTIIDINDINDDSILDILDDLHNNGDDLDSSMLHATQLNDYDKEALLNENHEMTIVEPKKTDKLNESYEKENEKYLNCSQSDESDDSCDSDVGNERKDGEEENGEMNNKRKKSSQDRNVDLLEESIACGSSSSSCSEGDDDGSPTVKGKEVDDEPASRPTTSHYCLYFEEDASRTPVKCKHQQGTRSDVNQNVCLSCEFAKELTDSLDHMAFLSPLVKNKQETSERKFFSSHDLTLQSPTDLKPDHDDGNNNSSNDCDELDIIDDTICEDPSAPMFSKTSPPAGSISNEQKKSAKKRLHSESKSQEEGDEWFTPCIQPPSGQSQDENFKVSNETVVKFFKNKDKFKMKLNLTEFKTQFDQNLDSIEYDLPKIDRKSDGELEWFTPALTLPSIKRIQKKIKKCETMVKRRQMVRRKKLSKLLSMNQSQLEKSQLVLDETTTSQALETTTSIGEIDNNLTIMEPKTAHISFSQKGSSSIRIEPTVSTKAKKKKTVRFDDRTEFINASDDPLVQQEKNEKGHHTVQTLNDSMVPLSNSSSLITHRLKRYASSDRSLSINDPSEVVSSLDSNETVLIENDDDYDEADSTKQQQSFYEYESILFPKSKLVDCASSFGHGNINDTIISGDKSEDSLPNEPRKESKKDKKILETKAPGWQQSKDVIRLTLMSMELHANTNGNLVPNPETDQIGFICYCVFQFDGVNSTYDTHLIVHDEKKRSLKTARYLGTTTTTGDRVKSVEFVFREEELFDCLLKAIRLYDPDILVGFEIQKLSWSFLIRRSIKLKHTEFIMQISRLPKNKRESYLRLNAPGRVSRGHQQQQQPQPGMVEIAPVPVELVIAGRVMLNLWRILRSEVALNIYSFENCCFHILNERVPKYNTATLTSWFIHLTDLHRWKTIDYYVQRAAGNIRLLNSLNLIGKTCEFAKVYGIEFYHVLSRGSQYRVESMMLRIARKLNYVAFSATQKQKVTMRAPECIPLTLEPESKFYTQPVAVLDFQSLYPSVIIAYNICFTTCLGRVESIGKEGCFKFGCGSLFLPDDLIKSLDLDNDIYVAPNGVAFVKKHIRVGILPIMLEDILSTRVMVKTSMKLHKADENLGKILDSRQLSLKLIANVTFGYTAANYSGRMPCVEVGDTIVRVARQTLENSINYIQSNQRRFGARVVYGDTDSVFVLFDRVPKKQTFKLSYTLVDEITNMNVKPVKLKFEKIYVPSILLAKKRYLGYMFESEEQGEPTLDVKGIEIIRRDGCQVSAKLLERCCRILFEFKDIDRVKDYFVRQIMKLINGRVNLKEFIIAKEYRGRDTYDNVKSVAACQVANKALIRDPLAEPLTGERVPYVIIHGMPGLPLYELVRSPYELIENPDLKLNYEYYVMKQIVPPLNRITALMNVNVFDWIKSLSFKPKVFQYLADQQPNQQSVASNPSMLSHFIYSADCVLCGKKRENCKYSAKNRSGLCDKCQRLDQQSISRLLFKFNRTEKHITQLVKVCQLCTSNDKLNLNTKNDCCSLDCPNTFHCLEAKQELKKTNYIRKVIDQFF